MGDIAEPLLMAFQIVNHFKQKTIVFFLVDQVGAIGDVNGPQQCRHRVVSAILGKNIACYGKPMRKKSSWSMVVVVMLL